MRQRTRRSTRHHPRRRLQTGSRRQLSDSLAASRKVRIIDSGYDRNHEDLSASNVTGEYDAGTGWWYTDENYHGTHVAGTIAAINNSGTGWSA